MDQNSAVKKNEPLFIGKLANLYQPPAYHTSNLIRRLHAQHESLSTRDRDVLDIYGELESMRLRHCADPPIPAKHELYELSLQELWGSRHIHTHNQSQSNSFQASTAREAFVSGTQLGENSLTAPVEAIEHESLYLHALKVFQIQPRIAHFMLCSTKANVLQEYCWPVMIPQNEVTFMKNLNNKRDLLRNIFHADRIGDTSLDRYLMLSHEIKPFVPRISSGKVNWSENFHILPRYRAFERRLRQPPTVLLEMARKSLHHQVKNDEYVAIPRPKHLPNGEIVVNLRKKPVITGEKLIQHAQSHISLEEMSMRPMPGLKPVASTSSTVQSLAFERELKHHSFSRQLHIKQSLQEQAFEMAIARYLEATLDALLEAVFQFILPILQIAHQKNETKTADEDKANDDIDILQRLSDTTAIAIDAVQFQHNKANNTNNNNNNNKNDNNNSSKNARKSNRRRLHIACHHERLYLHENRNNNNSNINNNNNNNNNSENYIKVKRRRLNMKIELPDQDQALFQQKLNKPKSIIMLRKYFQNKNREQNANDKNDGNNSSYEDSETESISDDSTEYDKSKKRKYSSNNAEEDQARKRTRLNDQTNKNNSNHQSNKNDNKFKKKNIPEQVPLPVPLSRVFHVQSTEARKQLGRTMLRWQKGGIMGAGKNRNILNIRNIRTVPSKSNMHHSNDDSGNNDNEDVQKDDEDESDLVSEISAITGDGSHRKKSNIYNKKTKNNNRSNNKSHQSSSRSSLSSSVSFDLSSQHSDNHTNKNQNNNNKNHVTAIINVPAPAVAGTLETQYNYAESKIDGHTGEFVIPNSDPNVDDNHITNVEEKSVINWEHILTILELIRDISSAQHDHQGISKNQDKFMVKIHPSLPSLPLNHDTVQRIRYRLVSFFTSFVRENSDISSVESHHKSVPSILRELQPQFPTKRVASENSSNNLPPSFLLYNNTNIHENMEAFILQEKHQAIQQLQQNIDDYKQNNTDKLEQLGNNQKKRVRFDPQNIQNTASLLQQHQQEFIRQFATQSTYGYGAVSSQDLHNLDNIRNNNDITTTTNNANNVNSETHVVSHTNHHLFAKPVVLAAQRISLRYQQHLARLMQEYPHLKEQVRCAEDEKLNPYSAKHETDDESETISNYHNSTSNSSKRKGKNNPFPLLSSPMKYRASLHANSSSSKKTKKDNKANMKKSTISPSVSIAESLHDYDTYPIPSAYLQLNQQVMLSSNSKRDHQENTIVNSRDEQDSSNDVDSANL